MKNLIFKTNENLAATIIRVALGIVLFPHGAQKLLGWFGGYGFSGTMGFFSDSMGLPWIIGFLVIMIESLGALLLIAGVATRLIALSVTALFIGITLLHLDYGFFMNWFGNQNGEGIEYFLLVLGMSVALIFSGGGKYSVDGMLNKEQSLLLK